MPNYVLTLLPFFKAGSHNAFSRLLLLCWETIDKPSIETRKVENLDDCKLLCYLNDNCGSLNFNKDPENNLADDSPRYSCKLSMMMIWKFTVKWKQLICPKKLGPKRVSPIWYTSDTLGCAASCATFFSYPILTSSMIYYWTDARQLRIYLLNIYIYIYIYL